MQILACSNNEWLRLGFDKGAKKFEGQVRLVGRFNEVCILFDGDFLPNRVDAELFSPIDGAVYRLDKVSELRSRGKRYHCLYARINKGTTLANLTVKQKEIGLISELYWYSYDK